MNVAHEDLLTEIPSLLGFEATLARLREAIDAAGLTIFAEIDHAENARKVELEMPPTVLLIYGNAKGGTPIMLAVPRTALDLPLRVLVRQSGAGTVIAFHPIAPVLRQAGVSDPLVDRLDPAQDILVKAVTS